METLLIYLIISIIGLSYTLLSRNKMIYMTAPEDIIPEDKKWKILKTHIITSIILGIAFMNLFVKLIQPIFYDWIVSNDYLAYSIIGSIILSFLLISGIIQLNLIKTNVQFANVKFLTENPDLLVPEEYYTTTKSLEDEEFWSTIHLVEFDESTLLFNYSRIHHEFSSRHPKWLTMFYHSLIEKKINLIKKGILKPYQYIFRKYEGDFHEEFCEFLIMLGEEKYIMILNNLEELSEIKINILGINNYNLSAELSNAFIQKTRKALIPTKDFDCIPLQHDAKNSKQKIKEEFPRVFEAFK